MRRSLGLRKGPSRLNCATWRVPGSLLPGEGDPPRTPPATTDPVRALDRTRRHAKEHPTSTAPLQPARQRNHAVRPVTSRARTRPPTCAKQHFAIPPLVTVLLVILAWRYVPPAQRCTACGERAVDLLGSDWDGALAASTDNADVGAIGASFDDRSMHKEGFQILVLWRDGDDTQGWRWRRSRCERPSAAIDGRGPGLLWPQFRRVSGVNACTHPPSATEAVPNNRRVLIRVRPGQWLFPDLGQVLGRAKLSESGGLRKPLPLTASATL